MKRLIFIFTVLAGFSIQAMAAKKIPSSATQYIFETLVKSSGEMSPPKAPVTISASHVECSTGSAKPRKFRCKAVFNIENKEVEKTIFGNNDKFLEYLKAKSAVAPAEMNLGSVVYRAGSITCAYNLQSGVYYSCESNLIIKF